MMNHKIRKSWISIVTLLLAVVLLPFSAFAVTEDTLGFLIAAMQYALKKSEEKKAKKAEEEKEAEK